jgi:hypothetical protein
MGDDKRKEITANGVIAQMVRDAIVNDPRKDDKGWTVMSDVYERAKLWRSRAQRLAEGGRCFYGSIVRLPMEEFLCTIEPDFGILDFEDGEVVECAFSGGGRLTGVIEKIYVNCGSSGGGHARVLFPNGEKRIIGWKDMYHSTIPEEILKIARMQLIAGGECPFTEKEGQND